MIVFCMEGREKKKKKNLLYRPAGDIVQWAVCQPLLPRAAGAEGSTSGALGPRYSLLETPTKINLHKGPAPSSGFAEFSSSIGSMAGAVTSSKVRRGDYDKSGWVVRI